MVNNHARKSAARARQAAEGGSYQAAVLSTEAAPPEAAAPETRMCDMCGDGPAGPVLLDTEMAMCAECRESRCLGCGMTPGDRHLSYCPYSSTYDGGYEHVEWDHTEHDPYEAAEFNREWDIEMRNYAAVVINALAEAGHPAEAYEADEGFELAITTPAGTELRVGWDQSYGWHVFDADARVLYGLPVDSLAALIPTADEAAARITALAAGTAWPTQTPADRPAGLEAGVDNQCWYDALAQFQTVTLTYLRDNNATLVHGS